MTSIVKQNYKGTYLVTYLIVQLPLGGSFAIHCDPPQDFDLKGKSTLTTCFACLRSRIRACSIATTKVDVLGFVLVNLARQSFFFLVAAICQAKRAF